MVSRNNAKMIQNGPVASNTARDDRLGQLPIEILDTIYSLVFHSENGPWTIHTKAKMRPPSHDSDHALLSILALSRGHRYKARRRQRPVEQWPDSVEGVFLRGLDWAYRHKATGLNRSISEIIYELTGVRRCRKGVSSHIQVLKRWTYDMKLSEQILSAVLCSGSELRYLNPLDDIEKITEIIQDIQDELPQLLEAYKKEHRPVELVPSRPILDFDSSHAITPNTEILRTLLSIASNPNSKSTLPFFIHAFSEPSNLSLTLVNRFHRTHALAIMASNHVFDFGDDVESIYTLHEPSPCVFIKRVRLTFVEGYMRLSFTEELASSAITVLPNLCELFIELWPRDPTREDNDDRAWGEQTPCLLEGLRAIKAKVVVEFRWEIDCRRFENEYVGVKRWRMKVESERVDTAEEEGMRRRSYELKGK